MRARLRRCISMQFSIVALLARGSRSRRTTIISIRTARQFCAHCCRWLASLPSEGSGIVRIVGHPAYSVLEASEWSGGMMSSCSLRYTGLKRWLTLRHRWRCWRWSKLMDGFLRFITSLCSANLIHGGVDRHRHRDARSCDPIIRCNSLPKGVQARRGAARITQLQGKRRTRLGRQVMRRRTRRLGSSPPFTAANLMPALLFRCTGSTLCFCLGCLSL